MTRKILLASTLLALGGTQACLAAGEAWNSPFTIQIGGFRADASTTVRLDSDLLRRGTEVSLEADLGVQRTKTLPDIQALWRINSRHGIDAQYLKLDRSGSRLLSGTIDWGDVSFPVSTNVESSFDSEVLRVGYRYSPINENGNELALMLGLHYTRLKTSITGQGGTVSDSASVDVPLPTIGILGSLRLMDNVRLTGYAQALKLKIDEYDGELLNAAVGLEWAFHRNAYAGVGYTYYRYTLESEKGNARGKFDFDFDGPTVYLGWSF